MRRSRANRTRTITTASHLSDVGSQISIPATTTNQGDQIYTESSVSSSTFLSTISESELGLRGFQGGVGYKGPQGVIGNQGPSGFQGSQGVQGVEGVQGFQGFVGRNGGFQGFIGFQGVQGFPSPDIGYQGPQGASFLSFGYQGPQGVQGFQGGLEGWGGAQGRQGPGPIRDGVTGNNGNDGWYGYQSGIVCDPWMIAYRLMGSSIKSISPSARRMSDITTSYTLSNGTMLLCAVYVPENVTVTGVMWYQRSSGSFSGTTIYGAFGLYSQGNGVLTLIASSTSSSTLWTATSNTVQKKAFSSTLLIDSGVYYIGALGYASSTFSSPSIGASESVLNISVQSFTMTNSNKLVSTLSSQTSLPTSVSMSATTAIVACPFLSLY